jgi:signal transduction histidine kinase
MSVSLRALAFAIWGLVPFIGMEFRALASTLFVGSAIFLALLFRSWRVEVNNQSAIRKSGLFLVFFILMFFFISGFGERITYRALWVGLASFFISVWEINELHKKIKTKSEYLLKVILGLTLFQTGITILTVIAIIFFTPKNIVTITENTSISNYFFWVALTTHLIVYLFIGSYLYQKIIFSENKISREKDEIGRLLSEREAMITSLVTANRAAASGALSASIAHELSQPLAATLLNISILRRVLNLKNEQNSAVEPILNLIGKETRRAAEILHTIKSIFKEDKIELTASSVDKILKKMKPLLESRAAKSGISLDFIFGSASRTNLNFSEFQQVIVNLTNNAFEALEAADKKDKQVVIKTCDFGSNIQISITDNGPGVPEKYQHSIFELMKTTKEQGLGIGLWLSKHIIEQRHAGTLAHFRPDEGGALFVVKLPINA